MRAAARRTPAKAAPVMSRAKVQKMLTPGDVFINTTSDGRLMASNRYWLVDAEKLSDLFDWWNLPVEKGGFYVNGRVSRTLVEPPNFDQLLKAPAKRTTVSPVMAGSRPLLFEQGTRFNYLFQQGEHQFGLNVEFLDFAAPTWQAGDLALKQAKDAPHTPVAVLDGAKVAALLMPVRLS